MGLMTLQEMRDEVRLGLGGRQPSDPAMTDARVDRLLRWSHLHISRPTIFNHRSLAVSQTFALVLNQQTYAFVADVGLADAQDLVGVRMLTNESRGTRLTPRTMRQMVESDRDGSGNLYTGEPTTYAVDGTSFYLSRTPNSTYAGDTMRLRYWAQPTALAGAGAASSLTDDWDEVIVVGAIWRGWRHLGQPDRAEILKAEFGQLVNEVSNRLALDTEDTGWEWSAVIDDYQET